jgi:phosphoribosylglycinamide formyltransferase-1
MADACATPLDLAVLLSGTGRTLENLLAVIARGELAARVRVVVSSRPGVRGLEVAARAGIPTVTVERRDYPDDEAFSAVVYGALAPYCPDLLVSAGYLRKLVIRPEWAGRMMNIHPSLLPAFGGRGMYGRHVHEAVLAYGVKVTGCTAHFVDNEYDHGPIILQRAVPVLDGDTPDTLAARVFAAECALYPEAIRLYAAGRLRIEGRCVRVLDEGDRGGAPARAMAASRRDEG